MTSAIHLALLTLTKTTPILLAALGGLLSESAGVINFALEGMMLAGAFGAVWATFASGSPWLGLAGGAAAGACLGLLHALATLELRANQIVSAISINLLATGLTGMLLNQVFQVYGTSPTVNRLPDLPKALSTFLTLPNTVQAFIPEGLSPLTFLALGSSLTMIGFFRFTTWGLRIRACGENPSAASAAGLSVLSIRFGAILASGVLAGLGGAFLSIGVLSQFVENMTQGRGYLAIAALILGRWRPAGVLMAALFFGLSEALSEWLAVRWSHLPSQAFLALPYLICFAVLAFQVGRREPPSALGRLDA